MAYLKLKFGDVKAESKGVVYDNIVKKHSKSLVMPTGKTTDHMAFQFFLNIILLVTVDCFEGMLNHIKIDEMVNDHSSSCNSKQFKKSTQISLKNHLQFLATPNSTTTDAMALKYFSDTM